MPAGSLSWGQRFLAEAGREALRVLSAGKRALPPVEFRARAGDRSAPGTGDLDSLKELVQYSARSAKDAEAIVTISEGWLLYRRT